MQVLCKRRISSNLHFFLDYKAKVIESIFEGLSPWFKQHLSFLITFDRQNHEFLDWISLSICFNAKIENKIKQSCHNKKQISLIKCTMGQKLSTCIIQEDLGKIYCWE